MLRADLRQAMTCEVVALLERAAEADEAESELDIPEELKRRERRLAVIEAAQAEIERGARERFAAEQVAYKEKLAARQEQDRATGRKFGGRPTKAPEAGPGDKDQVNLTDGESRIMPSPDGFAQCYNAQSAVDVESHLVVTADVSDECNDKRQVAPALEGLDGLPAALGKPVGLLADTGYFSRANVERCEADGASSEDAGRPGGVRAAQNRRWRRCSGSSRRRWGFGAFICADWRRCGANGR